MLTLDKSAKTLFLVSLLTLVACGKKKQETAAPAPMAALPLPTPAPEEPKERPVYAYSGDKYRDPFSPAGSATSYQGEAVFDPQKSTVRAIIFSPSMKSAILTVSGSGTYFIKSGQIFDIMGKTVKGYTAKVLVDRVILLGEADNIFEIKIKNSEEEEKTL